MIVSGRPEMDARMTDTATEPAPASALTATRWYERLAALARDNPFLVVLVSLVAVVMALLSPALLVGDSWMTLVAGRDVAEHGIPDRETLTIMASGARWIDQQWLGQLIVYGVDRAGGLAGLGVLAGVVIAGTYASSIAAARMLGASARSTFLVTAACLFIAPWSWQIRAQMLALPLFVWTLWLAADHVRRPSRRVLLALPLLLLWGNIHGSVVLGAGIVGLALLWVAIGRSRTPRGVATAVGFVAAAWVCALLTPYRLDIFDYYRLLLVDPPFGNAIVEWERTSFRPITVVFAVVSVLTAALLVWKRRRLTWFEIVVLALLFVGALDAIRGITWFGLAVAVLVPNALDGVVRPDVVKYPRVNVAAAVIAATAALVALGVVATKPESWFESAWPTPALRAVENAGPDARVLATDRHADWLLWHIPDLHGRVAFDIRFELLDKPTFQRLLHWSSQVGRDWRATAYGYDVVVLDEDEATSPTDKFLRQPGWRVAHRDDEIAVLHRVS
jgi:hypothetical protein